MEAAINIENTKLKLNTEQVTAVNHFTGPMMVIAGPGSGKTAVIIHRVSNLIYNHGIKPENILVVTFTKAAAEEMGKRFNSINRGNKSGALFATFHSFFYMIIRNHYKIGVNDTLSEIQRKEIVKDILIAKRIKFYDVEDFLDSILLEISLVKNELVDIIYYQPVLVTIEKEQFIEIFRQYESIKEELGKIDFDDMLLKCYNLLVSDERALKLWQERFPYILIDEFQDINRVQYETICLLAKPLNNIFVVGDDDQSVYCFRGARPEFLLQFPDEFKDAKSITLDMNYRSTLQILTLSNRVISENKNRYSKVMKNDGEIGNPPVFSLLEDLRDEANFIVKKVMEFHNDKKIPYEEMAVFYRCNVQSRALIDAFFGSNIPFHVKGEMPHVYDHWIAKDICAYFELAMDRDNDAAFERIYYKPSRMIDKGMMADAKKKEGSSLKNLYTQPTLKKWQSEKIGLLIEQLNKLRKLGSYDGFRYIMDSIDYRSYINNFSEYRKVNSSGFFEIANEISEATKDFETQIEFLEHIKETVRKLKEKEQESKGKKKNNSGLSGVSLSTMHNAKGLEYDAVFIATVVDGVIPHERSVSERAIEEERRLFYVALTRAREFLTISAVRNKYSEEVEISPFMTAILKSVKNAKK